MINRGIQRALRQSGLREVTSSSLSRSSNSSHPVRPSSCISDITFHRASFQPSLSPPWSITVFYLSEGHSSVWSLLSSWPINSFLSLCRGSRCFFALVNKKKLLFTALIRRGDYTDECSSLHNVVIKKERRHFTDWVTLAGDHVGLSSAFTKLSTLICLLCMYNRQYDANQGNIQSHFPHSQRWMLEQEGSKQQYKLHFTFDFITRANGELCACAAMLQCLWS